MPSKRRVSVTFTSLVWLGIVVALAGLVITLLGTGGESQFEASLGDIKIKTAHVGLALVVIGSALSATVATKLPKGVELFTERERTLTERMIENVPLPCFVLALLALITLLYSIARG